MASRERLYEPAAPDAVLCVGRGRTLYIGSLDYVDWHIHAVPVFIAGMTGNFRLLCPNGEWLSCRAAVIPAGVRHALDLAGDPLAVFYPDPNVAGVSDLARLGCAWEVHGRIRVGQQPELGLFREMYEDRFSLAFAGEALDELVAFMRQGQGLPLLDPRIVRVVEWFAANPADLTSVGVLAKAQGLSESRFLHLFSLVYIGIVTANQVVREAPKNEVPVIFVTLFPWVANWALTLTNNTLAAAGTSAKVLGADVLAKKGVYYLGLSNLGNGAPLGSMIWGCIAIFAILDKPLRGATAALVGAVLVLFGVIHSPTVGFAQPQVMPLVYAYLMIAGIFVLKHYLNQREAAAVSRADVPAVAEVRAAGKTA